MLRQCDLSQCPIETVVQAFNAGYAGYVVPVSMDEITFEQRFRAENLDPFASCLWFDEDKPVAILLVARRGRISRVAGLGVAVAWRGQGLGQMAIDWALRTAQERQVRWLELEVIASNTAARRLYERQGFRELGHLSGYELMPSATETEDHLQVLDPFEAGRLAGQFASGDLPWQQHPLGMAARTHPAYGLADLQGKIVALVEPGAAGLRLTALALSPDVTAEAAKAFALALSVHAKGQPVKAPALFPQDHRLHFFEMADWQKTELEQIWMRHDLN